MPGFVANTPAPTEATLVNDGFFPDVEPADCRESMRITNDITPARLRDALCGAILATNEDLQAWKATQTLAGFNSLETVPAPTLNKQSVNVVLYQRAVFNFTKAELTDRYRDIDMTQQGGNRADDLAPVIDQYRRQAILAIRQICGRKRSTIELI